MMRISDDHDFRIGYEILRLMNERMAEYGSNAESCKSRVIELKRNLRQYANQNAAAFDVGMGFICERRIVKDYGIDGFVELVSIPEVFNTLNDDEGSNPGAETFFKEFLEIHARPSVYDCTGQAFTGWYKMFRRNGQFWAYHRVCFDV